MIVYGFLERAADSRHAPRRINWAGRRGARNEGWVFSELLFDPEKAYNRLEASMAAIPEEVRGKRRPYRGAIIRVFVQLKTERKARYKEFEKRYRPDKNDSVRDMSPAQIRKEIQLRLARA